MIIELAFNLIMSLVRLLLNLIPTIDLTIDFPDTTSFREFLGLANYFIPIEHIVGAIGIILVVQNAHFLVKIFTFILKRIPFVG